MSVDWRSSHPPIQHIHKIRQQVGFACFEDDGYLAADVAFVVHGFGGGEDALFGELAAGAEAAVELIEVGFRPGGKRLGMAGDDAIDERVRGPIELARGAAAGRAEEFVDFDAEPLGQFMERAGVRVRAAADDPADGPLVERRGGDHIVKRQPLAGHMPAEVKGDDGRVGLGS
jgi:hypothetical protein